MAESFLDFISTGTGRDVGATAVGRQALLRQRSTVARAEPADPLQMAGLMIPPNMQSDAPQRVENIGTGVPVLPGDDGEQLPDFSAQLPDTKASPEVQRVFEQPTQTNPDVQALYAPPETPMSTTDLNDAWSKRIVDWEARRDKAGNLQVYSLPANDGGGRYEVAGINDKYHPEAFARISKLPANQREQAAADYIRQYTDPVTKWTDDQNLQGALRDLVFNRGPGGAAKILQTALGVDIDGKVGPKTKAALANALQDKAALGQKLRSAREQYENRVAGARPNLRKGLVNRWDNWLNFYNENLAA